MGSSLANLACLLAEPTAVPSQKDHFLKIPSFFLSFCGSSLYNER